MSKWRLIATAAGIVAALTSANAQHDEPSLDDVLKRAATYVADFRKQLSGIAAEESYWQEVVNTGRFVNSLLVNPKRRLKSDLLLIKPADADRYVELRDVFEVDGAPIRDRGSRVEELLAQRTASAENRIGQIIQESARYNIGSITRNINTPLMALMFLDAERQRRVDFTHVKAAAVFPEKQDAALNEIPVFRVATEMWNVEFRERGGGTVIRKPDGDDLRARGRFWINPSNGNVLISELIVDGGGVKATVTVSYQSEPLMGFLVPVEMRESYERSGERIVGHAEYGKFRQISK